MIALFKLILPILISLITSGILIPAVGVSIQNDNEVNSSNPQTTNNQVDEHDYSKTFTDSGIPLITLLGGILSARYIVGSWQTRKEISEIRKEILKNYGISFVNYVILMDTFVAKLVMEFAQLNRNRPDNKTALSKLLPWGFTFHDLICSSKEIPTNYNLRHFEDKCYTEDEIEQKFKNLNDENEDCYINFNSELLKHFRNKDGIAFKSNFYETRHESTKLTATISQYYEGNTNLLNEFNAMWEYMMSCYILVNRIMISKEEQEFINLLGKYNEYSEFLFDMMGNYEQKLISTNIRIK